MSKVVDSDLPPELRERLLAEIRSFLPAFLRSNASERHDPVGDVRELLNLEREDLRHVVAVHQCLDERVLAFGAGLESGLRIPHTSSARPVEASQCVRGPVDWAATASRRSMEAGNPLLFVVRGARRVFDTPENRALAWLLGHLQHSCRRALAELGGKAGADPALEEATAWPDRIRALSEQVKKAQQLSWLRRVPAEAPSQRTLARLRSSQLPFYAHAVTSAVESALELSSPSGDTIAEVLSRRYFEPAENWVIFEVFVALSLARAFQQASGGRPRKTRLLAGEGRSCFARFGFGDETEVALIYQAWPAQSGNSFRDEVCARHGLKTKPKRPDIFIVRTGPEPAVTALELKASLKSRTLVEGFTQLLGYMGEKPGVWQGELSGWLVAPSSGVFSAHEAVAGDPLWVVSADEVAEAAVARFAPGGA